MLWQFKQFAMHVIYDESIKATIEQKSPGFETDSFGNVIYDTVAENSDYSQDHKQ